MADQPKILRRLKSSKEKPKSGDVFVMQRKDNEKYMYGLVVSDSIHLKTLSGHISNYDLLLVYIYKYQNESIFPLPDLKKEDLLLPPEIQGYQGWITGYYMTTSHIDIKKHDVLEKHVFWKAFGRDKDGNSEYVDEYGNKVGFGKKVNISSYGMGTHYTIDALLSSLQEKF